MLENFSFNRVIAILSGTNPLPGADVFTLVKHISFEDFKPLFEDFKPLFEDFKPLFEDFKPLKIKNIPYHI